MKRIVLALGITALLIPLMGTLEPAEARVRWFGGADFSVGGLHFSLGFSGADHYSDAPYYYRTRGHLQHRGYQCGSACYIRDSYSYHAQGCPLVSYHFRHYGYDPGYAWAGYYRGGNYGHRYGPWSHGYRYERRHHGRKDHRYYGRYDSRGGRYDNDHDSDSGKRRHDSRYDRSRRDDRRDDRYDRRDDRKDRKDRGRASRSRSRSRGGRGD